jgi:hypothetical protein
MKDWSDLRKKLLSPVGLAVTAGLVVFAWTTIGQSQRTSGALVFNAIFAVLFGFVFSKGFHKGNPLFAKYAQNGRLGTMRQFGKMLRREEMPHDRQEQKEFLEYLETQEITLKRSLSKWNYVILIFLMVVATSILTFDDTSTYERLMGMVLLFALPLSMFMVRKNLQKIERLKARIQPAVVSRLPIHTASGSVEVNAPRFSDYRRLIPVFMAVLLLIGLAAAFATNSKHPDMILLFGSLEEKAALYLKESCQQEEHDEQIDLSCEDVVAHASEPIWTNVEGEAKTYTYAWTVSSRAAEAQGKFNLFLDVRIDDDGDMLQYLLVYVDNDGNELKVEPKDYLLPEEDPSVDPVDIEYVPAEESAQEAPVTGDPQQLTGNTQTELRVE